MEQYAAGYHRDLDEGARRSAEVVVPLVLELCAPRSVVDVGAGLGSWLSVFVDRGVTDVLAVDGVDAGDDLRVPRARFRRHDLMEPLELERTFDLAVSLEVAEHLPPDRARPFVATLARLAPVVLFSAAIPYQGGTHHLNEQWPEYWAALFQEHGYVPVDCLRRRVWNDPAVEWWYAQNLLVYVRAGELDRYPRLRDEHVVMGTRQLSLVHPRKYVYCVEWGIGLQAETTSDGSSRDEEDAEEFLP